MYSFLQLIFMQEQSVSYRLPLTMLLRMMLERPWRFSWSWEGVWKKEITNTEPPCKWLLNWVCCCTGIRSNNSKVLSAMSRILTMFVDAPPTPQNNQTNKKNSSLVCCMLLSSGSNCEYPLIPHLFLYPIYPLIPHLSSYTPSILI